MMSLGTLSVLLAAALLGPLLAAPRGWHIPTLFGELCAGIVLGPSMLSVVDPQDPVLGFLAQAGFALVMFVAGTHVPVRDRRMVGALRVGAVRALVVAAFAVVVGWLLSRLFGTGHGGLYAVLLTSSSAALILPEIDALRLGGRQVRHLVAQVAIADVAGIVALPFVVDPRQARTAAIGVAYVLVAAAALYPVLRYLDRTGLRQRLQRFSQARGFALELRINLIVLFALAALCVATGVSVLLAGFCFGLVVAAVGEPRRLAHQLFAVTEGFFGPVFFVWLGASLAVSGLAGHPQTLLWAVLLGAAAIAVHLPPRLIGQALPYATLAAAQLGVPIAAVAIGSQRGILVPGEGAAIILAAIFTVFAATVAAAAARRQRQRSAPG